MCQARLRGCSPAVSKEDQVLVSSEPSMCARGDFPPSWGVAAASGRKFQWRSILDRPHFWKLPYVPGRTAWGEPSGVRMERTREPVREELLPCGHASSRKQEEGTWCCLPGLPRSSGARLRRMHQRCQVRRGCGQLCQGSLESFRPIFHPGSRLSSTRWHEGQETARANSWPQKAWRSSGP